VPELFEIARKNFELEYRAKAAEKRAADLCAWRDRVMPPLNDMDERHGRLSTAEPDLEQALTDERLMQTGIPTPDEIARRGRRGRRPANKNGLTVAEVARRNHENEGTVKQRRYRLLKWRKKQAKGGAN
jgi:hypothetical protein